MKNILIIIANQNEKSFSHAMADTYKNSDKRKNCKIETIDLYKEKEQLEFMSFYSSKNKEIVKNYQEKIKNADEIVFSFPYWWGGMPAILKNFFDCVLTAGFAFTYENSKPKGLLSNKKVTILTTTGAPWMINTLKGVNKRFKNMFKKEIIAFCGMKLKSFNLFGGVDTSGKNTKKILDVINKLD